MVAALLIWWIALIGCIWILAGAVTVALYNIVKRHYQWRRYIKEGREP